MLRRDGSVERGKENPLIHGKVGTLGLTDDVSVDNLTLQICSAGRSILSSSLLLWQPAFLPLSSTLLSFNQTDFNSSAVPPVRRRFASLCSVPLPPPCGYLIEMEQTTPCAPVRGRDRGHSQLSVLGPLRRKR